MRNLGLILSSLWCVVGAVAKQPEATARKPAESPHATVAPSVSSHFERLIDVDYSFFMTRTKLPWGVDPFLKEPGFATVPLKQDRFELTGIFYTKDRPRAIVNGKSVGKGDEVGDRKVEEIGENYVILKKHGSEIELNLPPLRDPASNEDWDDGEDE